MDDFMGTPQKEVKESIFSRDVYSIGRLKFFIDNVLIGFVGGVAITIILIGVAFAMDALTNPTAIQDKTNILISEILAIILYLPILYFFGLNYAKRMYAIEWADENNAIQRGMLLSYGTFFLQIIPCIGILAAIVQFVIWIILQFVPSKR